MLQMLSPSQQLQRLLLQQANSVRLHLGLHSLCIVLELLLPCGPLGVLGCDETLHLVVAATTATILGHRTTLFVVSQLQDGGPSLVLGDDIPHLDGLIL